MSAFLRTGNRIDQASSVLLVATVLLATTVAAKGAVIGMPAALLAGLAEKYFSWRVALDADLFALLQAYPDEIDVFDAALGLCIGQGRKRISRSVSSRWVGARRLLCIQLCAFGLQAAWLLISLVG